MSAKQSGETVEGLTNQAIKKILDTLQAVIVLLVDQRNDQALTALQSCVGELFKRAAECRAENKKMIISEDHCGAEILK